MLAYLDALIAALLARDPDEIARLLAHPLVPILTADALAEARRLATGHAADSPWCLIQLRRRTAELLSQCPGVVDVEIETAEETAPMHSPERPRGVPAWVPRSSRPHRPTNRNTAPYSQMEFPLSA